MKESIEFTVREKYLINYYRDRRISGSRRSLASQASYIIAPLLCVGFYFWSSDIVWIIVGYALLIYRVGYTLWSGTLYTDSLATIFEKYETKLQELEAMQKKPE